MRKFFVHSLVNKFFFFLTNVKHMQFIFIIIYIIATEKIEKKVWSFASHFQNEKNVKNEK